MAGRRANQSGKSGDRSVMPASKDTQEIIRGSIDSGRSAEDVEGAATIGRTGMDSWSARGTPCGGAGGPNLTSSSSGGYNNFTFRAIDASKDSKLANK